MLNIQSKKPEIEEIDLLMDESSMYRNNNNIPENNYNDSSIINQFIRFRNFIEIQWLNNNNNYTTARDRIRIHEILQSSSEIKSNHHHQKRISRVSILYYASFSVSIIIFFIYLFTSFVPGLHVRYLHPPYPICYHERSCVEDFVVMSYRVWNPPPVWTLDEYMDMFGVWYNNPEKFDFNSTSNDVSFFIISNSAENIKNIYKTWGEKSRITYIVPDSGSIRNPNQVGVLPPNQIMMMIGYEEEDPENSYYSYQQRIIKGLVRSSHSFYGEWIFLCNDNVMVFPENLSRYYEKLDPDMPIIIGRVSSTASKSLSDAIASSIGKIIFSSGTTTNFNEDSSTKKEQQNKMIKYKVHPNNIDSDNNNHQITWISAFGSSSPGILVSRYIFSHSILIM